MDEEDQIKRDVESPLMEDDHRAQQTSDDKSDDLNDDFGRELPDEGAVSPLPNDFETPFSPPSDLAGEPKLKDTHQVTDTNIQPEEVYDEGLSGAAEAEEPNRRDAVEDYHAEE